MLRSGTSAREGTENEGCLVGQSRIVWTLSAHALFGHQRRVRLWNCSSALVGVTTTDAFCIQHGRDKLLLLLPTASVFTSHALLLFGMAVYMSCTN